MPLQSSTSYNFLLLTLYHLYFHSFICNRLSSLVINLPLTYRPSKLVLAFHPIVDYAATLAR